MKVAVIGCGTIANNAHIPAYLKHKDAEIKYFCDIRLDRAQAAVEKYGCGIAVSDYHEILNDPEVIAVSVCTPNKDHSQITCDFLRAGKHVLCEKPAALNYQEALAMQQAQHETRKTLSIGVCNRFNTAVNLIKDYIDAGELGNVHHVYVSFRSFRSIPGLGGAFTRKEIAGGGALIGACISLILLCIAVAIPKSRRFPVKPSANSERILRIMCTAICGLALLILTVDSMWMIPLLD